MFYKIFLCFNFSQTQTFFSFSHHKSKQKLYAKKSTIEQVVCKGFFDTRQCRVHVADTTDCLYFEAIFPNGKWSDLNHSPMSVWVNPFQDVLVLDWYQVFFCSCVCCSSTRNGSSKKAVITAKIIQKRWLELIWALIIVHWLCRIFCCYGMLKNRDKNQKYSNCFFCQMKEEKKTTKGNLYSWFLLMLINRIDQDQTYLSHFFAELC